MNNNQNIQQYANLEALVFANKMLENKQRFIDPKSEKYSVYEKSKMENIAKMQNIILKLLPPKELHYSIEGCENELPRKD